MKFDYRASRRRANGQVAFVGIALAAVMIILLMGYLAFGFLFDSQKILQGVVDAGCLNVARQAITLPAVELTDPDEIRQFSGIADKQDNKYYINLGNVNRMWGQVMLVVLNARKMNQLYSNSTYRPLYRMQDVDTLYQMAVNINNRLADKLAYESTELKAAFTQALEQNSGFTTNNSVVGSQWLSYSDNEDDASNVYLDPILSTSASALMGKDFFQPGYLSNIPVYGQTKYVIDTGSDPYHPGSIAPYSLRFVPLGVGKNSYSALTRSDFALFHAGQQAVHWYPRVPSAFGYTITAKNKANGQLLSAQSMAVAKDAGTGYPMSIPHGFVVIENLPGCNGESNGQHVLTADVGMAQQVQNEALKVDQANRLNQWQHGWPSMRSYLTSWQSDAGPANPTINPAYVSGLCKVPHAFNCDVNFTPTLLEMGKNPSQYITNGSLNDFLYASDPGDRYHDLYYQTTGPGRSSGYSLQLRYLFTLLLEVKPGAPYEIQSCLSDATEFHMGNCAVIYKDDHDKMVVTYFQSTNYNTDWSKPVGGANPPAWLLDELSFWSFHLHPFVIDSGFTLTPPADCAFQPISSPDGYLNGNYSLARQGGTDNLQLTNCNFCSFYMYHGYGGLLGKFTLFSITRPVNRPRL